MKLVIVAAVLLSACQPNPISQGGCDLSWEQFVGGPLAMPDMFPNQEPPNIRVIFPNTPVTKDYRPTRTNIYVDDKGVVQRVSCG